MSEPKGSKGHAAPVKKMSGEQIKDWCNRNCDGWGLAPCPYKNIVPETTAALQGKLEAFYTTSRYKHVCLYPGVVKNVGGYCWNDTNKGIHRQFKAFGGTDHG